MSVIAALISDVRAAYGPTARRLVNAARARWPKWFAPAVIAVATLAAAVAAGLVAFLLEVTLRVAGALVALVGGVAHWIRTGSLTHTVSDPVRHYLDTHTEGLGVSGEDLWLGWFAVLVVLWIAAGMGSRGARIGWAVMGAASAAAVWAGSPVTTRWVAAAIAAGIWSVLSVFVYGSAHRVPMFVYQPRVHRNPDRARAAHATVTKAAPDIGEDLEHLIEHPRRPTVTLVGGPGDGDSGMLPVSAERPHRICHRQTGDPGGSRSHYRPGEGDTYVYAGPCNCTDDYDEPDDLEE